MITMEKLKFGNYLNITENKTTAAARKICEVIVENVVTNRMAQTWSKKFNKG